MSAFSFTIKGSKVNFEMSILAFRLYCETQEISLDQLNEDLSKRNIFGISDILYSAHRAYCMLNDKELLYTKYEATEWIGELTDKEMQQVQNAILDVKMMGKSLREIQGVTEGSKKKTVAKK